MVMAMISVLPVKSCFQSCILSLKPSFCRDRKKSMITITDSFDKQNFGPSATGLRVSNTLPKGFGCVRLPSGKCGDYLPVPFYPEGVSGVSTYNVIN